MAIVLAILALPLQTSTIKIEVKKDVVEAEEVVVDTKAQDVRVFLEGKKSPLAQDVETLLKQTNWKLLIAISAIESQYCTIKRANNCWGIGGDENYRRYDTIKEAIIDAEAVIVRWQKRGRWLTVEDMNCHYVVPCNPNWVYVVNKVLSELDGY